MLLFSNIGKLEMLTLNLFFKYEKMHSHACRGRVFYYGYYSRSQSMYPPPWDFNHFPTWWYWWNKGYIINECPLIQNQKQTTGNSCMRVWNEFCSIGNGLYIRHYSRQAKPKFFRCFVGSGPKFQWKKSWRPKILIKNLSLHFSGNISCPLCLLFEQC